MSNLYATLGSDRSRKTTPSITANKEVVAHLRGWNKGVMVTLNEGIDGVLRLTVFKTGGSNDPNISPDGVYLSVCL